MCNPECAARDGPVEQTTADIEHAPGSLRRTSINERFNTLQNVGARDRRQRYVFPERHEVPIDAHARLPAAALPRQSALLIELDDLAKGFRRAGGFGDSTGGFFFSRRITVLTNQSTQPPCFLA